LGDEESVLSQWSLIDFVSRFTTPTTALPPAGDMTGMDRGLRWEVSYLMEEPRQSIVVIDQNWLLYNKSPKKQKLQH